MVWAEQLKHVQQGLPDLTSILVGTSLWAGVLAGDVKVHHVLSHDDVGHPVTIVCHRAKASATGDVLWVVDHVKQLHLLDRSLTGGEMPWLGQHLFQEGRVHAKVFGDHVETEEVPVDAGAGHGMFVQVLVLL